MATGVLLGGTGTGDVGPGTLLRVLSRVGEDRNNRRTVLGLRYGLSWTPVGSGKVVKCIRRRNGFRGPRLADKPRPQTRSDRRGYDSHRGPGRGVRL